MEDTSGLNKCPQYEAEDYWGDEFDEQDDWEELDDFDCGFVPGYGCQLAGTEDCDFECPYRDGLIASPYYPNCDLFGHEAGNPDE